MKILGIETSCDETSAAVISCSKKKYDLLSNVVKSQINIHRKYGGIVPEVAARRHVPVILPVIEKALNKSNSKLSDIDYIAVTNGPGLVTSLLVGIETAKILSYSNNIPLIAVNHLQGHILSPLLHMEKIKFPAIALLISGGHTQLILMKSESNFKTIGSTLDDACGEAFDKVAKMLDLPYPGGPEIEKMSKGFTEKLIDFPRPMVNKNNFDFSFSGLKTAVLYYIRKNPHVLKSEKEKRRVCASFQDAVSDVLAIKTVKAAIKYNVKTIMISGGASANSRIKSVLKNRIDKFIPKVEFIVPEFKFCTDNAAMIALAGCIQAKKKETIEWSKIKVNPNLSL